MPYHTRHRSHTSPATVTATTTSSTSNAFSSATPTIRIKNPSPPCRFPPPGLRLHPEDEASKVFLAVGKALVSVNNCAMTVKDLAQSALRNGLHCSGSAPLNAASQQITSFIRSHQKRCMEERTPPLIKSFMLTGTSEDDRFTPALYSRAGGTATRHSGAVTTAFRKGTQVWYLSSETGVEDPFERMGIRIPGSRKRQRVSSKDDGCGDSEEETRPKIKLKIRLGPLASSIPKKPVSSTALRASTPAAEEEDDVILLDSPPSSPSSSCSLSLPPYPIESHCRYLHDIPLSPFEVPEYASPPPDSEDDDHDFHTSMMVGADDSHDEESISLKYEADSDGEGADGRRSRSASWTTNTDPRTPKEGERPLSYPTVKIEGDSLWRPDTDVKDILDQWDAISFSRSSEGEEDMKDDQLNDDWQDHWMSPEDVIDLVGLATPLDVKEEQEEQEHINIERVDSADDTAILGLRALRLNSKRSSSIPLPSRFDSVSHDYSSLPPSPVLLPVDDADDVEILGPDSVTVQELDQERLWQAVKGSPHRGRVSSNVESWTVRTRCYEGVIVYESTVDGHTLRRRVDNSLVHLPSLLTVLAHRAPARKFMQIEGAMHVKTGDLQGTWVPLSFAKTLVKGRSSKSKEVMQFLQDELPVKRSHVISPMKLPATQPSKEHSVEENPAAVLTSSSLPLLPAISLPSQPSYTLTPLSTNSLTQPPKFVKRDSYDFKFTDKPTWQRDGFTDWKVNADSELAGTAHVSAPFSFLAPMKAASASGIVKETDCPLSPQEEEIFMALVDIRDSCAKSTHVEPESVTMQVKTQTRVQGLDEDADDEEGDDESEVKARPRRSKRVAAKVGSSRISEQSGSKRSLRLRK